MKSVGEVMAIGRTFQESLQKALRGLETGLTGLDEIEIEGLGHSDDKNAVRAALGTPTPNRLLQVAQAMRLGWSDEDIFASCKIDPWFLAQIRDIVDTEAKVVAHGLPPHAHGMRALKAKGFSDARLAVLAKKTEAEVKALRRAPGRSPGVQAHRHLRGRVRLAHRLHVLDLRDAVRRRRRGRERAVGPKKVVILGGGPNRIGQGIEFDYCCCHACFALRRGRLRNHHDQLQSGDGVDRLRHRRPALFRAADRRGRDRNHRHRTLQRHAAWRDRAVRRPDAAEARATRWRAQSVPILGTSPEAIDLAEDRDRFKRVLDKLRLKQPKNGIAYSVEQARLIAGELGYPLVVRPSYVLGGRAMQIIREEGQLGDYLLGTLPELVPSDVKARYPNDKTGQINTVLGKNPLLFDRYLSDAVEIDVDCLADGKDVFVVGIMEHIEEAGIHSGDFACSLPPHSLDAATIAELERQTRALALGAQRRRADERAVRDQGRRHLRARSQPARLAHGAVRRQGDRQAGRQDRRRIMAGESLARFNLTPRSSTTSASRKRCSRSRASPASTRARPGDEVDRRGDGPRHDVRDRLRQEPARRRHARAAQGHRVRLGARRGQAASSTPCASSPPPASRSSPPPARSDSSPTTACRREKVNKVLEGRPHIVDAMKNGGVQLVFNTTEGPQALADSRSLRRAALLHKVPYYTTLSGAVAAAQGIKAYLGGDLEVRTLQSYFPAAASKPTVAAISGWCLAGGLELALWCDLRIATGDAKLGFTERRFGVPLIDGGTQRLPRIVGMGRALEMILTGRVLEATEAREWGLVNEVVAAGAHVERALEIAEGSRPSRRRRCSPTAAPRSRASG